MQQYLYNKCHPAFSHNTSDECLNVFYNYSSALMSYLFDIYVYTHKHTHIYIYIYIY